MKHRVGVGPLPGWVDRDRLLGPGPWTHERERARAELGTREAADLAARLRGLGFGAPVEVEVSPPLKRAAVRAARTEDARRRRETTPGFVRPGARLDDEGRMSLTPEALALRLGQRYAGLSVVDATCGAGGNAIGFARAGCRVVAVEQDLARLRLAEHNARLYGVEIELRHGDARQIVPTLTADVVFVDPPWGAGWDRVRTTPDDLPLLGEIEWDVAKVPPSFVGPWPAEAWFGEAPGDRRRVKFVLLTRGGG